MLKSPKSEEEEPLLDEEGERQPLLFSTANQNMRPFNIHEGRNGDMIICIQDPEGRHKEGVIQIVSAPRASLSGLKRLPLNGFLEKVITQYGAYPLKVYIQLIKDLIYHKEKGVANTVKSAIRLPLVAGASILGGLLPTWLLPDLGLNLQESILSIIPFISGDFAFGIGVFTSVLVCSGWGASLSKKILNFTFSHLLDSPDTVLYFSKKEMARCLTQEDYDIDPDIQEKLDYAIEFLQGEYEKSASKFQDFEERNDAQKLRRIAEKLRGGDFKPLLKYATTIREKEMVSLSFDSRNQNLGKDAARQTEMFIAEKVIESFNYKRKTL